MRKRQRPLTVELLEDRCTPATWGNPWPDPGHLTLSFAPDGTLVGEHASNLFQTLNAVAPTKTWETVILRAFQTWASQTNINISVVPDQGLPLGTPGAVQSDARFGDIRVAAYVMPPGAEAVATPFELDGGTWSGDVQLNSGASFGINGKGQYDLFSVMLHEAGHVFGLADNANPASVMNLSYQGLRTGLGAADVAALQAIFGARSPDAFEGTTGNNQFSKATPLNSLTNLDGTLAMSVNADVTTLQDRDFYSFGNLLGLGGVDLTVRTAGISLLTPSATVYDAFGRTIIQAASTDPFEGGFVIHLTNVLPLSSYYVEIESGQQNVFGIGAYQLTVSDLPRVNNLLGTVTGTVTQGVNVVSGVLLNTVHTNGSFATATSLPPLTSGPNASYDDTYRSSFLNTSQADYYKLQAPPAAPGATTSVLTAMVWGLQNQVDAQVRIYDANHNLLTTTVVVNDGYNFVVQLNNAVPQQTYYFEVLPLSAGHGQNVGNYFLGVDFTPYGAALQDLADGTLTASRPQAVKTFIVNARSELFHFVLYAVKADSSVAASAEMSIIDLTGQAVFVLTAGNTVPVSGNISLNPGTYTVVFTARTSSAGPLPPLTFRLLGETLTDPQGPEGSDPTGDPGGSPNTDPNGSATWGDGSTHGVPPFDPSSDPYSGNGPAQGNNASSITMYNPGDQTDLAGDGVSWSVSASDTDPNATMSYSATGLPPGLDVDSSAGTISGSIPNDAGNSAPYVVTVTVTDSDGSSASQTFNWTVNPPIIYVYTGGDQTNLAGDTIYVIQSGYNSDSYPLTFSAVGLPPGVNIDSTSGMFYGSIPNSAAKSTPYVVTVTATDTSSGVSATATLNWTVNPPIVTLYNPGNISNNAGDTVNFGLWWSTSNNAPLTFTAGGLPPGLSVDSSAGVISGTIAANAASPTPYTVTITAIDPSSGVSSTVTFNWMVS